MPQHIPEVRHASRELVRELGFLDPRTQPRTPTHSQTHALIELEARGPMSQVDLAALLRLDKSRMSRVIGELEARGWAKRERGADQRTRIVSLTSAGKKVLGRVHEGANARVADALGVLDESERAAVVRGLGLYARALTVSRRRKEYVVRKAQRADAVGIARLIRTVMPEFGASGPGYAIMDPEVDDMPGAYSTMGRRAAYWVVVRKGTDEVVGGGGFAPLVGGDKGTTELRKMYFYPELRGLGFGAELLAKCTEAASEAGYTRMYLETLSGMTRARALYERHGFERLSAPLGNTGHSGCNMFYAKQLERRSS